MLTAELPLLDKVNVTQAVPVPTAVLPKLLVVGLSVTDPPLLTAVTVNALVALAVRLPLVPAIVTVAGPVAAVLLAVSVNVAVALPSAEGVTELGENDAVTPEGSPEALNVTAEAKLLMLVTVTVLVADAPCAIDRPPDESDSEKEGDPLPVIVSAIVVLADKLPLAPVIVTVAEPVVAVLPATSVTALDPVVGLVPNDAVTPLGKPLAENVTLPLNPFAGLTVMVLVPDAPCASDRLPGVSDSVNDGC